MGMWMGMKMLGMWILGAALAHGDGKVSSAAEARAARDGANFRTPVREYASVSDRWRVHVEKVFMDRRPERAASAVKKLEATLESIFLTLPERPQKELVGMDFYLLWGKSSPLGGRSSGMNYIRRGEPGRYPHLDPRWEHAIIIFSAENLLFLDELWSRKALMHELAHAWHLSQWPEKHPPVMEAWKRAEASQLYREVMDYKSRRLPVAYACKNQLEYFAELSAMYFVGGDYEPFNRDGLKAYDPGGCAMVEALWEVGPRTAERRAE